MEYNMGDKVEVLGRATFVIGKGLSNPTGTIHFKHSTDNGIFYDVLLDSGIEILYNKTEFELKGSNK